MFAHVCVHTEFRYPAPSTWPIYLNDKTGVTGQNFASMDKTSCHSNHVDHWPLRLHPPCPPAATPTKAGFIPT
jgi:hypothetical protein